MNVLGINESHNASAALVKDGVLVAAAQEERFTRRKGRGGLPKQAISYCLHKEGIDIREVDLVVFGFRDPLVAASYENKESSRWYFEWKKRIELLVAWFGIWVPTLAWFYVDITSRIYRFIFPFLFRAHRRAVAREIGIEENRCVFLDHHTAHAWAAYGFSDTKVREDLLIISNDGMGDQTCGVVVQVRGGKWQKRAATPSAHSLGLVYSAVTEYLGLRANEDEHKVMGLAPYASQVHTKKNVSPFAKLIKNDQLTMRATVPAFLYRQFFQKFLNGRRFDHIAAGLQKHTENILVNQVKYAIRRTKVRNIALSGGLSLNIKANQKIAELPPVLTLYVCPSGGDESTAIGAALWGFQLHENHEITIPSLYLGPDYSEKEIYRALRVFHIIHNPRYTIHKLLPKSIPKTIAHFLAGGKIVARFAGRMEFGARALGNRSILADPRNPEVVHMINKQIKRRDFWMPFAPTILAEREQNYIRNPKHIPSSYMTMSFHTTNVGRRALAAAVHPADGTCRPQLLHRGDNPSFYAIVKMFEKETGVGAVLNTSFNIHGEPIVCSPHDALSTFMRSGLEYLLLGSYLVRKVSGFRSTQMNVGEKYAKKRRKGRGT